MNEEFDLGKQTSSVKLIKNSKGYNWEIKIYNEDLDTMLKEIETVDAELKSKYKQEVKNE